MSWPKDLYSLRHHWKWVGLLVGLMVAGVLLVSEFM